MRGVNERLLRACTMDLTEACNLRCTYCFTHGKTKRRLSSSMGKKIINFFFDNVDLSSTAPYSINWWGGEPLLEWELLKELTLYAEDEFKRRPEMEGHRLVFGGTTNGFALTPAKLKFLAKHNTNMLISVDGIEEVHDQYRVRPDGSGSFKRIWSNVKKAMLYWGLVTVRMSLSKKLVPHLLEAVLFLYQGGVRGFMFSPVHEEDWTDEDFEELRRQYDALAEFLNHHSEVQCHHLTQAEPQKDYPCGAGRTYVGFSVDGKIYPCLYGDAKIICNPEIKTMETAKIGDKVLSHDGFYHPITKIWSRQYSGNMIGVKPLYSNEFQWATPNHEILAIRGKSCRYYPRTCKESCKGYWQSSRKRFIPCKHKIESDIEWIPIGNLTKNDFLAYPILKGERDIPYEEDLLYLFGWFLAEGSTSGKNKKPQIIKFSLGSHEEDVAIELSNIFEKYYGKSGTIKHYPENNKIAFYVCDTKLAKWFEDQFGKGTQNKKIPHDWLFAPIKKQKNLLRGLFYGDGTHYKKQTSFTTTSELLATQVRSLLLRQKVPCGYTTRPKHGIHSESYNVNIWGQSFSNKLFEKWQIDLDKDYIGRSWFTDDYFIVPIKDISKRKHSGLVYNLEVEHAHSYVNSISFSNCHRFNKYGPGHEEHNASWCMGDIETGFNEVRRQFVDYPALRREQCGDCSVYEWCLGGCYATLTDLCGDPFKLLPSMCKHAQLLFGEAKPTVTPHTARVGGCICHNMCFLEGTADEIVNFHKNSTMFCGCYATSYNGPTGEGVWRPIDAVKVLPEKGD